MVGEDDKRFAITWKIKNFCRHKRAEEDYGPESVKLNLKICVLSNKGLTLKREWVENTEFSKGTGKGFQKLLERAVLFGTRKEEYLAEDTLTVHCQFSEVGTTPTETEYVFARSEMEVHRKLFLGTVCDFSQLNPGDSSEVQLQMLSSKMKPLCLILPKRICV
ncbi:hypothetical protein CDAR_388731 [Caerostris darwini]|uniref:Uncharacterized protein n=1 Tax=Caerostris darwini TaxID=1538125 RepID=A0AAV4S4X9_9ARAC|nr:hypothetical protein CDAR_388731 [Caerostris darwini]